MANPSVVVQVGHDPPLEPGFESGTGAGGELELVRSIGDALVRRLKSDGRFRVTRIPGRFSDEIRNGTLAVDAFIALHADAASPSAQGYTFGFPPDSQPSKRFADLVGTRFAGFHRSSRRRDNLNGNLSGYYGWNRKRMPTDAPRILVEHGFVTNPVERQWLFDNVQALADAEYAAIAELLGLEAQDASRHTSAVTAVDTNWPWFADWALWKTGRGRFAAFGKENRTARPASAPARIPPLAFEVLRELQLSDKAVVADAEISVSSATLTPPRVGQDVLERYMLKRDHAPHTDDDARAVAKHYSTIAARGGLDPLVVVAQMVLETDNLRSKWSQTHKNLAGIGVTGDDVDPATVPKWTSWQGAVVGHVGRVLAYAVPDGAETPAQKTLIDAALAKRGLPPGLRGVAPTIAGLAAWAGDSRYTQKVAKVANDIRKA
jgi:hypothetical protein